MDKKELEQVLRKLDERVSSSIDMVVVGGAAMILHFGASRATRDIDVIVLRGDPTSLREAVKAVADECDLPDDWLTDAAKGFADILLPDFYHRLVPLAIEFRHLRLYALGLPDQMAMKIVALREQDLEDLELLLSGLSEEDKKTVIATMHHIGRFRPDWAQKVQYFLEELGWEID